MFVQNMLTWIQFNKEQKEDDDDNGESEHGIHKVGCRV